ncbi:MAG: SpoIIE family protein phosphatase [Capsulimonadaceae bacterium]
MAQTVDNLPVDVLLSILDTSLDVLSRFDRDLRYTFINETGARLTGIPRASYLGKTLRELDFPEGVCSQWEDALRRTFASAEPYIIEYSLELPSGRRYFEGTTYPDLGLDGAVSSVITVARDITDRVTAGTAIREGQEILRLAVDFAAIGTWDFYPATGEIKTDRRCRKLLGLPTDSPIDYKLFLERMHPVDRQAVDRMVHRALDPSLPDDIDFECRTVGVGDAKPRWVIARGRAFFDDERRVALRLIGTTMDVTHKKETEGALDASEARLRLAFDAAAMGTWEWEVATGRMTWTGRLEEIHGMAPGSFDGRFETYMRRIHPEDRDRALHAIGHSIESGEDMNVEFRVIFPDGDVRWVAENGRPVKPPGATRVERMVGIGWDITAHKRAEEIARGRAEREALLNRIGQMLRRAVDVDELRLQVAIALGEGLGADRCYFINYDPSADRSVVGPEWRREDLPPLSGKYRISEIVRDITTLYSPGRPSIVTDTEDDPRYMPNVLPRIGCRAILAAGLFSGGHITSALAVAMASAPRQWTPEEGELLQSAAALLQSAVDAARARDRDRNIANRLQDALRPALPGKVPGLDVTTYYQPALEEAEIGGDFFDVFALEPDRHALVVADLSGKGLQAAAQIATLRHMLRTVLYQQPHGLRDAVEELNNMIANHDLLSGFATMFVGIFDSNTRTIDYISCGQEPALVWHAQTCEVEQVGPTGPVVGAFPGVPFEQDTIFLKPGDVIAWFTDGLTESGTNRAETLGIDGVSQIFSASLRRKNITAATVAEDMIAGVLNRVTPAGIRDDVCLLVARVDGGEVKRKRFRRAKRTKRRQTGETIFERSTVATTAVSIAQTR